MPTIRRYRPEDLRACYDICVRTGAAGGDARGRYTDEDLLPDTYTGPYLALEPDFAFVLDIDGAAVGYVIGTPDTENFVRRYRQEWVPRLLARRPGPHAAGDADLVRQSLHPERMLVPGLQDHPAHLHIDLLPSAQGRGFGRQLIDTFLTAVGAAGARGVHLGLDPANTRAAGFYTHLGFRDLLPQEPTGARYLGRPIVTTAARCCPP